MSNSFREFLNSNDILYDKITIKNGIRILSNDKYKCVVKKKSCDDVSELYKYLDSRSFNYYPNLLLSNDKYNVYEYIDGINISREEKAYDIMRLIGLLHAKTSYYVDINIDDYKRIYEDVIFKLDYLYRYYVDIISAIDKSVYMSPSSYLLARNISIIFSSIRDSRMYIEKWYNDISERKRVRVCVIHNNLDIDHYIRSEHEYLISWDNYKRDMPIYDFLIFYKKYAMYFDFVDLFRCYTSIYKLIPMEIYLLFAFICIPDKLEFNKREYDMCKSVNECINYLYVTKNFIKYYLPDKDGKEDKGK